MGRKCDIRELKLLLPTLEIDSKWKMQTSRNSSAIILLAPSAGSLLSPLFIEPRVAACPTKCYICLPFLSGRVVILRHPGQWCMIRNHWVAGATGMCLYLLPSALPLFAWNIAELMNVEHRSWDTEVTSMRKPRAEETEQGFRMGPRGQIRCCVSPALPPGFLYCRKVNPSVVQKIEICVADQTT